MNETIIYRDHPSWLSFLGLFLIAGASLFFSANSSEPTGWIIISACLFLLAIVLRYRKFYFISDMRVISRIGLIANNTSEMELKHIRGMNVRQNIFERLLGIGTLEINSAADGGAEVVFHGIKDPIGVKENIYTIKGTP